MDAFKEIGTKKAFRYLVSPLVTGVFRILGLSPLRVMYLRLLGATIGKDCVIHNVRFFNWYRGSFRNLKLRNHVFLGDECLFDLADVIECEDHVTFAERVTVLTHMNVGFKNHPLQSRYPSTQKPTLIKRGAFIGASVTLVVGCVVGEETFVAAGSVVSQSLPDNILAGGVPAKKIRDH